MYDNEFERKGDTKPREIPRIPRIQLTHNVYTAHH